MKVQPNHLRFWSGNNYYEDDMGNRLDVTIDQFLSVDGQTPYDVGRKGWFWQRMCLNDHNNSRRARKDGR